MALILDIGFKKLGDVSTVSTLLKYLNPINHHHWI